MGTKQGAETRKNNYRLKTFGTIDILEILGPAGTIPPTQSISSRLAEFGISSSRAWQWCNDNIPQELYDQLKPFQQSLGRLAAVKTNEKKYGGRSPMASAEVRDKVKSTCFEKYGVANVFLDADIQAKKQATIQSKFGGNSPLCDTSVLAKVQATNLERYGGISPTCDPEVLSKARLTSLDRYGVEVPVCSPEIRAKRDATNLERYGSECSLANSVVHEKAKATFLERYGAENPFASQEIKDKIKATLLERYGALASNVLQPEEILRRLDRQGLEPLEPIVYTSDRHKTIKVRCKKCGHEYTTSWVAQPSKFSDLGFYVCPKCGTHGTRLQDFVTDYIESLGYTCKQEQFKWMNWKEIDCYIEELGIGFEINGYETHNSTFNPRNPDKVKSKDYHSNKTTLCLEHGIKLYHIWHYEDLPSERENAIRIVDKALSGKAPKVKPGDTYSRDELPDPSIVGLPCVDLGPQPFSAIVRKQHVTCYTSGLWQF